MIRDHVSWLILTEVLFIGTLIWLVLFVTLWQPRIASDNDYLVLGTANGSLAVEWPRGHVAVWVWDARGEVWVW